MMCDIARKNIKYLNDIMYKTQVHGRLIHYERCDETNSIYICRCSSAIESVIEALAIEEEPESIVGRYDEIMELEWLIALCKKTQCKDLELYLYTCPFVNRDFTSENMPKAALEFRFVTMVGGHFQNYPNYVEYKDEKQDLDYKEKPTSFVLENINKPKFDLTCLDITIKTDINEFFIIKDYVIDNKIKTGSKLKQFQIELQQNANSKKT